MRWRVDISAVLLEGPPRQNRMALERIHQRPAAIAACFPPALRDHVAQGHAIDYDPAGAIRVFLEGIGGQTGYRQWLCLMREARRLRASIRADTALIRRMRRATWSEMPDSETILRDEHGRQGTHADLVNASQWRETAGPDNPDPRIELPAYWMTDEADILVPREVHDGPETAVAALRRRIRANIARIDALPDRWRTPADEWSREAERWGAIGVTLVHDWRDDSVSWTWTDPAHPDEPFEFGPYLTLEIAIEQIQQTLHLGQHP